MKSKVNNTLQLDEVDFEVSKVTHIVKKGDVRKVLDISADKKKHFLRQMLLIRQFELTAQDLFFQGKVHGGVHVYAGEEAIAVGVCQDLEKSDFLNSTHRGHGHCLAKGADPKLIMAELFGKKTGYSRGRGGSMHIYCKELGIMGTNGIVGGGIPLAVGAGMHSKLRQTDQVSVCFFGDGAVNEGVFSESLNLAAKHRLPVIFICENNGYATTTTVQEVSATIHYASRGTSHGVPSKTIDGNNVVEVYQNAAQAIARARSGGGPSFLECLTYRHCGHYCGEDTRYRPEGELEQWLEKDPIKTFYQELLSDHVLAAEDYEKMEQEIKAQIAGAIEFAEQSPLPNPDEELDPRLVFTRE